MKKSFALLIPVIAALTFIPALVDANNAGDFSGGVAIGTGYAGIDAASTNGLIVQGNVAIGTTVPATTLHISGVASPEAIFDSFGTGSYVITRRANGTASSPTATHSGDILGSFYITGYNATGWNVGNAGFSVVASENHTSSAQGNELHFFVTTNGTTSAITPMYLSNAGNLGIGSSSPSQALDVNGKIRVGTFAASSSTTVCQNANVLSTCTSALRFKKNVQPSTLGLKEVLEMKPVTFDLKDHKDNWEKHDFGFVAEDMAKINPVFVTYDEDGEISGVRYMQLTAVNAQAIQELNGVIEKQQFEIDELKRAIERLMHEK